MNDYIAALKAVRHAEALLADAEAKLVGEMKELNVNSITDNGYTAELKPYKKPKKKDNSLTEAIQSEIEELRAEIVGNNKQALYQAYKARMAAEMQIARLSSDSRIRHLEGVLERARQSNKVDCVISLKTKTRDFDPATVVSFEEYTELLKLGKAKRISKAKIDKLLMTECDSFESCKDKINI